MKTGIVTVSAQSWTAMVIKLVLYVFHAKRYSSLSIPAIAYSVFHSWRDDEGDTATVIAPTLPIRQAHHRRLFFFVGEPRKGYVTPWRAELILQWIARKGFQKGIIKFS
jgi:hypothetical protein